MGNVTLMDEKKGKANYSNYYPRESLDIDDIKV